MKLVVAHVVEEGDGLDGLEVYTYSLLFAVLADDCPAEQCETIGGQSRVQLQTLGRTEDGALHRLTVGS